MVIESIKLENFRNYETLELTLDPGTNIFYGENAQGKTNILESVYLCGTTKSHKGSKDREMIRFDQEEAHIRMKLDRDGSSYSIDMHLKKNRPKGIAINGVPIRKAGELLGLGNFVFFSPEDLNIIKSGPGERGGVSWIWSSASSRRSIFSAVQLQQDPESAEQAAQGDHVPPGIPGYAGRLGPPARSVRGTGHPGEGKFVGRLNEIIGGIHQRLSGGRETLVIHYEKMWSRKSLKQGLRPTGTGI